MKRGDIVAVTASKLHQKRERKWQCRFVERLGPRITLVGVFDKQVEHPDLGIIGRGTVSYEFYWSDCNFNLFRFHQPNGDVRLYYGNVALPPVLANNTLSYVDLDIDVMIHPEGRTKILDKDEFEENSVKFGYQPHVVQAAESGLKELLELASEIARGDHHFRPYDIADLG